MRTANVAVAVGLLFAAQPVCSSVHEIPADPRLRGLRGEIAAAVESGRLVSVSVGAIEGGELIWAESFGFADRETGAAASLETRYGLASLGKSITATAVMTLVEAGRLKLDDPVSSVLGPAAVRNFACDREPTVRQLLNMTSGVPHGAATYYARAPLDERDLVQPRSIVVFCPGTVFHYSNYSIALADRVVEAASGTSFGSYLGAHVFAPLGMHQSALGTPAGFAEPAVRYDGEGMRIRQAQNFPRSSRGLNASLLDLLKYAAFNLEAPFAGQRPILSHSSLRELHMSRPDVPGAITALGWASLDLGEGRRWLITNGNDMGVQSSLIMIPSARVAIVMLSNSSGFQADEFAMRAADLLAPGLAAAFERERTSYERWAPVQSDVGWIGAWSGQVQTVDGPLPIRVRIDAQGDALAAIGDGEPLAISDARLAHGLLTGHVRGRLALEERSDGDHHIDIALHRRGAIATGHLTANFENARGKFELPAAVRLARQE